MIRRPRTLQALLFLVAASLSMALPFAAIAQLAASGKPAAMLEKIAEGKIKKFYEDACLMNQAFVKDPSKTIDQLLKESIAALGENIQIRRFARFVLGEGLGA